jgi:hypothetical protein
MIARGLDLKSHQQTKQHHHEHRAELEHIIGVEDWKEDDTLGLAFELSHAWLLCRCLRRREHV